MAKVPVKRAPVSADVCPVSVQREIEDYWAADSFRTMVSEKVASEGL